MGLREKEILQEIRKKGAPVSEGIAIGQPHFLVIQTSEIPEFPIKLCEVDAEIARYRKALFSSREDLKRLRGDLAKEGSNEVVSFIDTHIQMLDDPLITVQMEANIRHMLKNTESVFKAVIRDYEKKLTDRQNSFFEERLIDVRDVSNRILGHLSDAPPSRLNEVPFGSILFTKELSPSHTAAADPARVAALVSESGGGNSHAALIARSKGIPYISNIEISSLEDIFIENVIVDGITGELILNPSEETLSHYRERQTQLQTRMDRYDRESTLPAETIDGYPVRLLANVGSPSDIDPFPPSCEGVGLFRTEYLLLPGQRVFPSEDEQYSAYRAIVEKCEGHPIVMRVFDLGGDKSPGFKSESEDHSVLGSRGIRFLLKLPALFSEQLRALLRSAKGADVRLLLPLISDVSELLAAKRLIAQICQELDMEMPQVGCMIEVPSAVMTCDAIAAEADFLSIGTNDLVQYTLGIDRSNAAMSDLFYAAHPSVLRMIKMIAVQAARCNKPVTICGEMASNPLFTPALLGFGLREFSCAPRYIPLIKETVRSWSIVEAYQLSEKILQMNDPAAIRKILQEVKK